MKENTSKPKLENSEVVELEDKKVKQPEVEKLYNDPNRRSFRRSEEVVEVLRKEKYSTSQLNRILYALDAFKKGDISVRLTKEEDDIFADIAEAYNSMVEMISGVGG